MDSTAHIILNGTPSIPTSIQGKGKARQTSITTSMHHDDGPTQAAKKEDPLQRNFNTIVCPSHNLRVESAERLSTTEFRIGISVVLTPHHSLDTNSYVALPMLQNMEATRSLPSGSLCSWPWCKRCQNGRPMTMSLKNFMRQKRVLLHMNSPPHWQQHFFHTTIITTTFETGQPTHCHFYSEIATTRTPARHHGVSLNIQQLQFKQGEGWFFCGRCDGGGGDRQASFFILHWREPCWYGNFCWLLDEDKILQYGTQGEILYETTSYGGRHCLWQKFKLLLWHVQKIFFFIGWSM